MVVDSLLVIIRSYVLFNKNRYFILYFNFLVQKQSHINWRRCHVELKRFREISMLLLRHANVLKGEVLVKPEMKSGVR